MKNNLSKINWKIFLIYSLIITAIFVAFYPFTRLSLAFGFGIGSCFSFISYQLKDLLLRKSLLITSKRKIKFNFLSFLGFMGIMFLLAILVFVILMINKHAKHNLYTKPIYARSFYPINIVAFLFGTLSVTISIYAQSFWQYWRERRENGRANRTH